MTYSYQEHRISVDGRTEVQRSTFLLFISISMCRTRRNEQAVVEHVDHEPARAATCKTELTVPNHYGKHIFVPSFSDS